MNRKRPLVAMALACLLAACLPTEPTHRPAGHVTGPPAAHLVAVITVDGQEVHDVIELNDAVGWVIQIHPCNEPPVFPSGWAYIEPTMCYLSPPDTVYGQVRIEWLPET